MTNSARPLKVAWFSFFPVEWLPDMPDEVRQLPRLHPANWQQVLLSQLEGDDNLQLHILVLRRQFEADRHFERHGVHFHLLRTPGGLRAPSLFWVDTWLIRRALSKIGPDLVHAWGTEQGAALVAARLKYPAVVTMQGLFSWMQTLVPLSRHDRLAALLERRGLKRSRIVTAESRFAVGYLRQHYPHLEVHQVEHAPKALFHEVRRDPQLHPVRLVFVGTLTPPKGIDLLLGALDAIRQTVAFELVLITGTDEEALARLRPGVSAELWSRLQVRRNLTSEQVAAEFARATLLVYPTRADNSPNAVKEAVVAGLPAVATDIGGIPDYVVPGENGLLFPSNNADACAAAVRTALGHPLFSRGLVAPETLARMRDYLSPRRMGDSIRHVYQRAAHPKID